MASALQVSLPAGRRPAFSVQVLALSPEVYPGPHLSLALPSLMQLALSSMFSLFTTTALSRSSPAFFLSSPSVRTLICPVVGSAAISSALSLTPPDQTSFLTWSTYLTLCLKALEFGDGAGGLGWGFGPRPQLWWVPTSAPGITSVLLQIKAGLAHWSLSPPTQHREVFSGPALSSPQGAQGAKLTRDCRTVLSVPEAGASRCLYGVWRGPVQAHAGTLLLPVGACLQPPGWFPWDSVLSSVQDHFQLPWEQGFVRLLPLRANATRPHPVFEFRPQSVSFVLAICELTHGSCFVSIDDVLLF